MFPLALTPLAADVRRLTPNALRPHLPSAPFRLSALGFLSAFGFRISDFLRRHLPPLCLLLLPLSPRAQEIQLPGWVGENMVLQQPSRAQPTSFWCWSRAKKLEVLFAGKTLRMKNRPSGSDQWVCEFEDLPPGGPVPLIIREPPARNQPGTQLVLSNVFVGEVWLWGASSKSFELQAPTFSPAQIQALRTNAFLLRGQRTNDLFGLASDSASWRACDPATAPAAACFFAAKIAAAKTIPVGIITLAEDYLLALDKPHWSPDQGGWRDYPDRLAGEAGEAARNQAQMLAARLHEQYKIQVERLKLRGLVPDHPPPPKSGEVDDFAKIYSGPLPDWGSLAIRGLIW